jgi:hypothetical protein
MNRDLKLKDVQVAHKGGDVVLSLTGERNEVLNVVVPSLWRGILADVLLQGHDPDRNKPGGGRFVKERYERMESGELTSAATGWDLWRRNPDLTGYEVACMVGISSTTLLDSFRKYHGNDYERLCRATGRGRYSKGRKKRAHA